MLALVKRIGSRKAEIKVGKTFEALVEAELPEGGFRARLRSNQPVFVDGGPALSERSESKGSGQAELGSFVPVRITGSKKWSLLGTWVR